MAAGAGKRLRPLTLDTPKCLVKINGACLIDNALFHLRRNGINTVVIVVGHMADEIKEYLSCTWPDMNLIFVSNELYESTGNIISFRLAAPYLDEDFILIEDDIFFEAGVIDLVCSSGADNLVVVDTFADFMNGTGVNIENNILTEMLILGIDSLAGHKTPAFKTVNIYKFSISFAEKYLFPEMDSIVESGRADVYYETAIRRIIKNGRVCLRALSVEGLKWCEIDNQSDISRAESIFSAE